VIETNILIPNFVRLAEQSTTTDGSISNTFSFSATTLKSRIPRVSVAERTHVAPRLSRRIKRYPVMVYFPAASDLDVVSRPPERSPLAADRFRVAGPPLPTGLVIGSQPTR
jgi:hypothetical protein